MPAACATHEPGTGKPARACTGLRPCATYLRVLCALPIAPICSDMVVPACWAPQGDQGVPGALPSPQVLQASLELPRCSLGGGERDYLLAAALLERFTRKQELRLVTGVHRRTGGPSWGVSAWCLMR